MRITGLEKGVYMKNKKIKNLFISMLVCATLIMIAGTSISKTATQASSEPEFEWIHTYDSIINDKAYYVEQTMDGGYIVTGSMAVTWPYYAELLLAKTDADGEESWRSNFPIADTNLYGTVVHQTTDGGYIIVGSVGGAWLWDVLVLKADANGDLVWQRSFGKSDGPDHGADVLQTSDGGYIVLGDTSTYGQGGYDLWLIKLTADGTEQWNKTIGGTSNEEPKRFIETDDGGYVIVGRTETAEYMEDVWVVQIDEDGDVLWQKTYGDSDLTEYGVDVKTVSNGYIVLGSYQDMNWTESLWVLRLDTQGTLLWDKLISEETTVFGTSITPTTDGGYFITGNLITDMETCFSDAYFLKLNHQGARQWVKTLELSDGLQDEASCGIQPRDGGYVAVGHYGEFIFNRTSDTFILKIEAEKGVILDEVTGGLGMHAHVKNLGTTEATDVTVSITITGGILRLINVSYAETISIPAEGDATVSCKPFLGLGPIDITVTVNGAPSDYQGKQLIILTRLSS
jgi:hypothetical protein